MQTHWLLTRTIYYEMQPRQKVARVRWWLWTLVFMLLKCVQCWAQTTPQNSNRSQIGTRGHLPGIKSCPTSPTTARPLQHETTLRISISLFLIWKSHLFFLGLVSVSRVSPFGWLLYHLRNTFWYFCDREAENWTEKTAPIASQIPENGIAGFFISSFWSEFWDFTGPFGVEIGFSMYHVTIITDFSEQFLLAKPLESRTR